MLDRCLPITIDPTCICRCEGHLVFKFRSFRALHAFLLQGTMFISYPFFSLHFSCAPNLRSTDCNSDNSILKNRHSQKIFHAIAILFGK